MGFADAAADRVAQRSKVKEQKDKIDDNFYASGSLEEDEDDADGPMDDLGVNYINNFVGDDDEIASEENPFSEQQS